MAFAALATLMALAGLSTTGASAETDSVFPPEIVPTGTLGNWTTFDDVLGRVYGFAGDGYAVIAGDPLDAVCTGAPPPVLPKMIKQNQSGTWEQRLQPGVQMVTAHVYETDLGVFQFFDSACPLFGTDGFPQPFAVGDVAIRDRAWTLEAPGFGFDQPAGRYSNGVRGDVFTADGDRFRLRAWVTYDLDANGVPDFLAFRLAMQPLGNHS